MFKKIIFFALLCWLTLIPMTTTAQDNQTAQLRFGHFMSDVAEIDIQLDGVVIARNVAPFAITDWLEIPAGEHEFQILPSGLAANQASIFGGLVNSESNTWSSVPVIGSQANNTLGSRVIREEMATLNPEFVQFYFFNAMEDQSFSIWVFDTLSIENMTFNAAEWGTSGDPDDFQARITAQDNPENVYLDVGAIGLEPLTTYWITMVLQDGVPTPIIAATALQSRFRIAHFAVDLPPLDVIIADERLVQNVPFATVSNIVEHYAPAPLAVVPTETGVEAAVFTTDNFDFQVGTTYTLILAGEMGESVQFVAETPQDYLTNAELMAGENALVHLFHGIADAPPLDIRLEDGTTLIEGMTFDEEFAVLELPTGRYSFVITVSGEPENILFNLEDTLLRGGSVYLGAAIGRLDDVRSGAQRFFWYEECIRPEGC